MLVVGSAVQRPTAVPQRSSHLLTHRCRVGRRITLATRQHTHGVKGQEDDGAEQRNDAGRLIERLAPWRFITALLATRNDIRLSA